MPSLNKATLMGHLGRDPEVKYLPNGDAVCNFSLATSETWKDKQSSERKEDTQWHNIVAFRRLGEICGEYLRKGMLVYVEGKIATRKWQDKEGRDRYTTEIIASEMKMLSGRAAGADAETAPAAKPAPTGKTGMAAIQDMDDQIPF